MGAHRGAGQRAKRLKVHPGWLQAELLSPPTAWEQPRPEPVSYYLPVDDPCLSMLIGRLQRDFPLASEVAFIAGVSDWSGGHSLTPLLHTSGWLLVARHRLQSDGVVTEHLVSVGCTTSGPIAPILCQHLTTCSFDRGGAIEAPDALVAKLIEQARQLGTNENHKCHRQRVKDAASPRSHAPVSVQDLDRQLDAIERRAATMRKRIAAIPFKTEEYHELDRELTRIIQEFHATLKQRRMTRLEREKQSPRPAKRDRPAEVGISETLEPLAIVCWKLEP